MMRLFWVGNAYPEAVKKVFCHLKHEGKDNLSYRELKANVDSYYINYFATGWCKALESIGYETANVVMNARPLQKIWLRENGVHERGLSLEDILLLQIKQYRPQIIFAADCCSAKLLRCVRNEVPSVKLIIGWAGSAVAKDPAREEIWKTLDIILCCAPESVAVLKQEGARAFHMNHAFPVDVRFSLTKDGTRHSSISFIGSLVRGKEYHLFREKLLLRLLDELPLDLYSPSASVTKKSLLKAIAAIGLYDMSRCFPERVRENILSSLPMIGKICTRRERPFFPVNMNLYRRSLPAVFGMEMFDALYDSDVVLNIHADSSPDFASNMRLYEATGVGSCLLTDNKKNIADLFAPDEEVVVYDSPDDCVEKARWLIQHPQEREKIAEAGKKRCLQDHTYDNRVMEFDRIIRRVKQRGL